MILAPWKIGLALAVLAVLLFAAGRVRQLRARQRRLRRGRPHAAPGRGLPAGDAQFQRLRALLHDGELFRDPDLDEVSLGSVLGLSRAQVRQLVAHHTGSTVSAYINGFRVQQVCRLLEAEPEVSLRVLARRTGFRSRSSLYRAFRSRMGCSPSAWRGRHAGN